VFLYERIKSAAEFEQRLQQGRSRLHAKAEQWSRLLTTILDEYRAIKKQMKNPAMMQLDMVNDMQQQLNHLFPKRFITDIEKQWLQQYPRYLAGINKRFEKSRTDITRDRQLRLEFSKLWDEYLKRSESLKQQHIVSEQLDRYRWMPEEYRVSLFAQELKTRFPVSEKRLKKYWNELSDA
jgi:ATP-dependent helicase HrpA